MRRVVLGMVVFALSCAAAGSCWAGVVATSGVTGVAVSGGSVPLSVELGTDPAFVGGVTLSVDPTYLEFTKGPGPADFFFTLNQINSTATAWEGLEFSLDGGSFNVPPVPTFPGLSLGDAGSVFGIDDTRARLLLGTGVGEPAFVNLDIALGGGTSAVLTVTPLVPEPGAAGLLGVTTLLLSRSRGRRR